MKNKMIYEYEDVDEYLQGMWTDAAMIIKKKNYIAPVRRLKNEEDRSLWYSTYKELINRIDRYDIEKKIMQFPEIYWGDAKKDLYIEEMKKRYLFLAENSLFLLAPLVRRESDGHFNNRKYACEEKGVIFDNEHQIYMVNDIYLSVLIEKLLFASDKLEDSELYKKVLEYKEDPKYLERVKNGLDLVKTGRLYEDITNIDIAMYTILKSIRGYIEGQAECFNKQRKLCILDEYFRIVRYSNDGKMWTSGFEINDQDMMNNLKGIEEDPFFRYSKLEVTPVLSRGVGFSQFINAFEVKKELGKKTYICTSLSEKEKQDIYLKLHDELPWDLDINCVLEEPVLNSMNDSRLIRPENTNPCDASFRVKEGNIFVYGKGFYHLCGECGYIVQVPSTLLSEGIRSRISDRCSKDKNLFRKMELISELQALDDKSLPHHKVLFKNDKN